MFVGLSQRALYRGVDISGVVVAGNNYRYQVWVGAQTVSLRYCLFVMAQTVSLRYCAFPTLGILARDCLTGEAIANRFGTCLRISPVGIQICDPSLVSLLQTIKVADFGYNETRAVFLEH